jgi:hypothetical protein
MTTTSMTRADRCPEDAIATKVNAQNCQETKIWRWCWCSWFADRKFKGEKLRIEGLFFVFDLFPYVLLRRRWKGGVGRNTIFSSPALFASVAFANHEILSFRSPWVLTCKVGARTLGPGSLLPEVGRTWTQIPIESSRSLHSISHMPTDRARHSGVAEKSSTFHVGTVPNFPSFNAATR